MRVIPFPFQKVALALVYVQNFNPEYRFHWQALYLITVLFSFYYQGARIYTPLVILVMLADLLGLSTVKMVLLPVAAGAMMYLKIYYLEIIDSGDYKAGHRRFTLNNSKLQGCIYYPTHQTGSQVMYMKDIPKFQDIFYDIFYFKTVNPQTLRLIPRIFFGVISSYLTKIPMQVQGNAKLCPRMGKEGYEVIIFSHGLGGTMHTYSNLHSYWASKGRIVVSINHQHDKIIINNRVVSETDLDLISKYIYKHRHSQLYKRVRQFQLVSQQIDKEGLLSTILEQNVKIESIYFAGHSYGGATAFQSASLIKESQLNHKLAGIMLFDPWLFPSSPEHFDRQIQGKLLIINTDYFFHNVEDFHKLQQTQRKICQSNKQKAICLMTTQTGHQLFTDCAYFLGQFASLVKLVKNVSKADCVLGLNQFIIELFLNNFSEDQIVQKSNQYADITNLKALGVTVRKQFRFQKSHTESYLQSRNKKNK